MNIVSTLSRNFALPHLLKRDNRSSTIKYLYELDKSQWWPYEKLRDLQLQKLCKLLIYAYENTEYYKKVFDERGIKPESIKSIDDLEMLPILTRDTIYDNIEALRSQNPRLGTIQKILTGGTTGQQATIYRDQESFNIKLAASWRFEEWIGRKLCDRLAYFWPAHADYFPDKSKIEVFKDEYLLGFIFFYTGSHNTKAFNKYYHKLLRYKPRFIKVFPSALNVFLNYMEANKLSFPKIDSILTTGEPLYDVQKSRFEKVFDCPIFVLYSSREGGNTAGECDKHEGLHVAMETTIVEFNRSGKNVENNQVGDILITDLTNYAMPLIRYAINDQGKRLGARCSCGRGLELISNVVGRLSDDFWGTDGQRHTGHTLSYHLTMNPDYPIGQIQIIQNTLTDFYVRITDKPEPTEKTFAFIESKMKGIIGETISIKIEVVKELPKEKSGKVRLLICNVDQFR
jgi:phenylacetate-CoA ligase